MQRSSFDGADACMQVMELAHQKQHTIKVTPGLHADYFCQNNCPCLTSSPIGIALIVFIRS